jgi:putative endonuclease
MFIVYILYSEKLNKYYTGTTDNLPERLESTILNFLRILFTSSGIPWVLKFVIVELHSKQAYAIEQHIKSMKSRVYIENLMKYPEMVEKLKSRFS